MLCFKCRNHVGHEPNLDRLPGQEFGVRCESCDRVYAPLDGHESWALILGGEPTGKWRLPTALEEMARALSGLS